MKFEQAPINGLIKIIPEIYEDQRGFFAESYHKKKFEDHGITVDFVQDNYSFSKKGVLRGLHFQVSPHGQGKLVSVMKGAVIDVAVDLRKESPTFGKYYKEILDEKKGHMLYIPESFAHGFFALEDTVFVYKCTHLYQKNAESGIIWNDPQLNISWEIDQPIVSEKDQQLKRFEEVALML